MRKREPINVIVHYPETEEGMEMLKKSQATVMIDILEKQLGDKFVAELFKYMEEKKAQKS